MFLFSVIDSLEKAKVKYAVAGGYALALQGIVRATIDVGLVVKLNKTQLKAAQLALESLGLTSRLPLKAEEVIDFREEYIRDKNLIAWSFVDYKDPSKIVDILVINDLSSYDLMKVSVSGRKIPVISLKSLYKMKTGTGRKKDELDLELIKDKLNEK